MTKKQMRENIQAILCYVVRDTLTTAQQNQVYDTWRELKAEKGYVGTSLPNNALKEQVEVYYETLKKALEVNSIKCKYQANLALNPTVICSILSIQKI